MQLCETVTPRGRRYYVDGRRVSEFSFDLVKIRFDLDCLITRCHGETVRHYACARNRLDARS